MLKQTYLIKNKPTQLHNGQE